MFLCKLLIVVFLCLVCRDAKAKAKKDKLHSIAAFPCIQVWNAHRNKKCANQSTSQIYQMYLDRETDKAKTVGERIHLIYLLMKEEISNYKVLALQNVVNSFWIYFAHQRTSNLSNSKWCKKNSKFWSSMVGETTDVSTKSQYISDLLRQGRFNRVLLSGWPSTLTAK